MAVPDPALADAHRFLLRELAATAAEAILPLFAHPETGLEEKADGSPVTQADREAERRMRRLIRNCFPNHGVLGEEFGPDRTDAEWVWVLDPIDGTRSFVAGVPLFGTLIGLLHHGRPVLGAIHLPVSGLLLEGDGATTTANGRPTRVRPPPPRGLAGASLLASDLLPPSDPTQAAGRARLLARVAQGRSWGDCHGYALLCTGRADLMLDPVMCPWDLLPLVPVVEGAGGTITTWQGSDAAAPGAASALAATDATLHRQALAVLQGETT